MTPERWQQIKSLLEASLDRDPFERDAFLNEACAGDPDLRMQVEGSGSFGHGSASCL